MTATPFIWHVDHNDLHEDATAGLAVVAVVDLEEALMGAKDVAEMLGVKVPNLKHVKIEPVARISGGAIPVYLRAHVEAEKERKAQARRAAAAE